MRFACTISTTHRRHIEAPFRVTTFLGDSQQTTSSDLLPAGRVHTSGVRSQTFSLVRHPRVLCGHRARALDARALDAQEAACGE